MTNNVPSYVPSYVPAYNRRQQSSCEPRTSVLSAANAAPNFVSVFDDPQRFDHCYRMAEILAASSFVPEGSRNRPDDSFKNNPGNCLIALDLAGRLGLAPTAVFPHLYVINGRPAMSAQFIIALVNRSGRFSRIRWEEGIDGEVQFEVYGKLRTVPNYYAEAMFTELSSGAEFRSTRVSVETARRSGWLTKNESKWQTLPQEMCRWRSASWLCKSYAPELIFGLDFADDVRDYDSVAPIDAIVTTSTRTIDATPAPVAALANSKEEEEQDDESAFEAEMTNSTTLKELSDVANRISRSSLPASAKGRLRDVFKTARVELVAAQTERRAVPASKMNAPNENAATHSDEPAEEPAPKAPRKRKTAKSDAKQDESGALIEAIRNARTQDELKTLAAAVKATVWTGQSNEKEVEFLNAAIEGRSQELEMNEYYAAPQQEPTDETLVQEESSPDDSTVTRSQERAISSLRSAIDGSKSREELEKVADYVEDAVTRSLITRAQGDELLRRIDEVAVSLIL